MVRIEVDADGVVRATQLVLTSGFARLDEAALASFTGAQMIPSTIDGEPVSTWANIPVAWNLAGHGTYRPHRVNDGEIPIPIILKSYRLKVGPNDYLGIACHASRRRLHGSRARRQGRNCNRVEYSKVHWLCHA